MEDIKGEVDKCDVSIVIPELANAFLINVIKPGVSADHHPSRHLSFHRDWEIGMLHPLIFTFQRHDFRFLRETALGCKTGK